MQASTSPSQRINGQSEAYYAQLELAFDAWAPHYDVGLARNPVAAVLRAEALRVILASFRPGEVVLDIGAGTGTDAIALAKRGVSVVAVDLSDAMLGQLRAKAKTASVDSRIVTHKLVGRELPVLLRSYGAGYFDGALSNFGALNCEPRLPEIIRALHGLLRRNACFLAGLRNRFCLAEAAMQLARGHVRATRTRTKKVVVVSVSAVPIEVRPYSVEEFIRLTGGLFRPQAIHGLGIIFPPFDLVHGWSWARSRFWSTLDEQLGQSFPWNRLADYFLVRFARI
jgi:SAM-dependent methyltransferase